MLDFEGESYIALTPQGYEDLSLNISEIIRYVIEANSQLDYYREER